VPEGEEFYAARASGGDDCVPLTIPYRQGDVFRGLELPPLNAPEGGHLAMLFMHPCTMREGVTLRDFVNVVRVRKFGKGSSRDATRWEEGNYSEIPLKRLKSNRDVYVAEMSSIWTVPASSLPRTSRIASLTDAGLLAIQHRLIFHLTRLAIGYEELAQVNRALLAELEMQHGWVGLALSSEKEIGLPQLEDAEYHFETFLSADDRRARLRDTLSGEPAVRREYHEACLKRFGSLPL
jgi:hypothetical protein